VPLAGTDLIAPSPSHTRATTKAGFKLESGASLACRHAAGRVRSSTSSSSRPSTRSSATW